MIRSIGPNAAKRENIHLTTLACGVKIRDLTSRT
jgi:hypothetical protein